MIKKNNFKNEMKLEKEKENFFWKWNKIWEILSCQDVAARGLDLPSVDWIVQFNPPVTAEEYVHRVGRTARVGKCGKSLIFLSPNEAEFVKRLASRGIRSAHLITVII